MTQPTTTTPPATTIDGASQRVIDALNGLADSVEQFTGTLRFAGRLDGPRRPLGGGDTLIPGADGTFQLEPPTENGSKLRKRGGK